MDVLGSSVGANKLAIDALVEIGTSAVQSLTEALADRKKAEPAMWALATLKDRRAVEPLIRFAHDGKPRDSRPTAARSLGFFKDSRIYEPLIELTRSNDEKLRREATEALGKFADRRAIERLRELLRDPSSDVRWSAVSLSATSRMNRGSSRIWSP